MPRLKLGGKCRAFRLRYYEPVAAEENPGMPGSVWYRHDANLENDQEDPTCMFCEIKMVAVTPLNLDMTARVDLNQLENYLRDLASSGNSE